MKTVKIEIPYGNISEMKRTPKGMNRGKTGLT